MSFPLFQEGNIGKFFVNYSENKKESGKEEIEGVTNKN